MNILDQYAEIKLNIAALEQEAKQLLPAVQALVEKEGKQETSFGKFSLSTRTLWKYSEKVNKIAEKLKLEKIREEEKGIATPTLTSIVTFTAHKIK